ncbi:RNA-directed DNA polymerase, eukaryota [Tanacetum coccineum]
MLQKQKFSNNDHYDLPLIYNVNEHTLHFGRHEFCLISGFKFRWISFFNFRDGDITFRDRVFPEKIEEYVKNIDLLSLIEDEVRFTSLSDSDSIRVCLLLSLEVIFMGHDLGSTVDDVFLRMVEDLEDWNDFPWGEHMWRELYAAIRNVNSNHKQAHHKALEDKDVKLNRVFKQAQPRYWLMEALPMSFIFIVVSNKSQVLGVGVPRSSVESMATSLGCFIIEKKFRYLRVMVGERMSRYKAWDDVVLKLKTRLSKWKAKTLSIGGRLTLLKSVLGASPLYNMSIFKVLKGVLKVMESIRSNFFKGTSLSEKKISWIAWDKVLASKKKGGLGVSSYFALNRALLLKWVWRFVSQDGSLWFREVHVLKSTGFDFMSYYSKRIGDGQSTSFWLETWKGDILFRDMFPRLFALKSAKHICVADKMSGPLNMSFRRPVRGGVEQQEFSELCSILDYVMLSQASDRWYCSLSSSGDFCVKEVRTTIDDMALPSHPEPTRRCFTVCVDGGRWIFNIGLRFRNGRFRNRSIFDDNTPSRSKLFEDIVSSSFLWCNSRSGRKFSRDAWLKNPHLISL